MLSVPVPEPPVVSSYLTELERELAARGSAPVTGNDLLRVLRPIAQALEEIGRHRETIKDTVQFVNVLQSRLMIVEELPPDAPFGSLIRRTTGTLGERATLYLGNGTGQPLSRLVPQPL